MHTHMQYTQIFIFLRELTPFFDFLTGKTRNNNFNCQFQTNTITPTNRFEYVCMYVRYFCVCMCVCKCCAILRNFRNDIGRPFSEKQFHFA